MHIQWIRHWKHRGWNCLRFLLIILLSCSLVMMGTLFWIDNSWALIFDDDPQTMVNIGDYLDGDLDDDSNLQDDDDGVVPITGGTLIRGNGAQDDNKEDTFYFRHIFFTVLVSKGIISANVFIDRRTVASYHDFGHLKVMPAGDSIANTISSSLVTSLKGLPCIAGGLLSSVIPEAFEKIRMQ